MGAGPKRVCDPPATTERHLGTVAVLFGVSDVEHNHALVVLEALRGRRSHVHH
jgi:hypothetical protein